MQFFKINNKDFSNFVQKMKVDYEVLCADGTGRDAAGNTYIDIVNRKYKINITFRPMNATEMASLLTAIQPYVVTVAFRNPRSNNVTTAQCYTGTASPEFYTLQDSKIIYNAMQLNFIEL